MSISYRALCVPEYSEFRTLSIPIRGLDAVHAPTVGVCALPQDPECILHLQRAALRRRLVPPYVELSPGAKIAFRLWMSTPAFFGRVASA